MSYIVMYIQLYNFAKKNDDDFSYQLRSIELHPIDNFVAYSLFIALIYRIPLYCLLLRKML